MVMKLLVLLISSLILSHSKLIIKRKSTGDEVYGGYNNCSHGETVYRLNRRKQCIISPKDIGCQLSFLNDLNQIKTLNIKNTSTLWINLPYHDCYRGHTVLKVQYWNHKEGKNLLSVKNAEEITHSMVSKLHITKVHPQAVLTFKKQFPGLLVKISFGCINPFTSQQQYHPDDCTLLKFYGKATYPIKSSYFKSSLIPTTETTTTTTTTAAFTTKISLSAFTTASTLKSNPTTSTNSTFRRATSTINTSTKIPTLTKKTLKKTTEKINTTNSSNIPITKQGTNITASKTIKSLQQSLTPIIYVKTSSSSNTKIVKPAGRIGGFNNGSTIKPVKINNNNSYEVKKIAAIVFVIILATIIVFILLCTICKKRDTKGKYEKAPLDEDDVDTQKTNEVHNPVYAELNSSKEDDVFTEREDETDAEPLYAKVNKQKAGVHKSE